MAEILSFNSPNGSGSVKKGNFLKSFWNWFSSQDKSLKLSIATILFVALATPFIVNNLLETRQRAQEPQSAIGQEKDPQFISNELLVKIKKETKGRVKEGKPDDTGIPSLDNINRKFQAKGFERVAKLGKKSKSDSDVFAWYKITLPGEKEIISGKLDKTEVTLENNYSDAPAIEKLKLLIADLKRDANIEAIEPNYIFSSAATPNDPYYSSSGSWGQSYQDLWGMHKINAASSWDQSTGSTNIVVADIDSGVDRNHEDLQGQMWVNTGETPGNSQDDDGNGYVDDYHGWDWVNNDNDPMDDYGHGTHTAGSIAAVGNNAKGAVGVNWISKIMSLKYLNSSGNGTLANSLSALVYAADNGARISSNSWNCWYCTNINANAIDDAVKYEHEAGMVIVVAAGNDNSDALNHMPASSQYSIAVSASDHTDARWEYSSWGEKVDVAAPGNEILSLKSSVSPMCPSSVTVGVNYCRRSGTSMAAPHVSGLAALLLAKNPALTNEQVRQIIRNGADDTGTPGKDNDFGYGRINAANSMGLANTVPHTPFINSPRSRTALNGIVQIIGSVPGPNFQKYIVEVGSGRSPTSWTTLADSTNQVINGVLATLDSTTRPNGFNIIRVTSLDNNNKPYQFAVHDLVVDNIVSSLDSPNFVAISNSVSITGSAYTLNNVPFANYILEWGVGDEPTSWSSSGIILSNGGTQPINSGQLATWNTSALTNNQEYSLRLTVNSSVGSEIFTTSMFADSDLLPAFPKILSGSSIGENGNNSPVVADLDGNGVKEIVVADSNKVYAFRKDGTTLAGFPISVSTDEEFRGLINAADLDNNGKKEIIAISASPATSSGGGTGKLYVFNFDGTILSGWPKVISNQFSTNYQNGTAVGDIEGDSKKEIVTAGGQPSTVYAYRSDGTFVPGFPKALSTSDFDDIIPNPIIANVQGDTKGEIIAGFKNQLHVLNGAGLQLSGWPFIAPDQTTPTGPTPNNFMSLPAVGDIDGNGILEIVAFASSHRVCGTCPANWYVFRNDGTIFTGFPKVAPKPADTFNDFINWRHNSYYQPLLADLNKDGKDEIYAGIRRIWFYNPLTGVITEAATLSTSNGSVVPSDLDGNDRFEIGTPGNLSTGNTDILRDDLSTIYWRRKFSQTVHPMVVADLDNDGQMEKVGYDQPRFGSSEKGLLLVWKVPNNGGSAKSDWPMLGGDPAISGRLSTVPPPPPADSDGDGYTDVRETYLGTDPFKKCANDTTRNNESGLDGWPLDFDDNQRANTLDVGGYVFVLNKRSTDTGFNPRYDLDGNGIINTIDIGKFVTAPLNATCTP